MTRQFNRLFVERNAMRPVPDESLLAARVLADAPGAGRHQSELISTPDAAVLMGLSEATLRNYAWLNSLAATERAARKLQEPPAGLPVPVRKSGRLMWAVAEVEAFVGQKKQPR
jgi:predicted DNA-binding transcriptional regulator AlpA